MSALPHTQPYLFECICLHNIEGTLWSVVSRADIYIDMGVDTEVTLKRDTKTDGLRYIYIYLHMMHACHMCTMKRTARRQADDESDTAPRPQK